jgi:hypothetical protein
LRDGKRFAPGEYRREFVRGRDLGRTDQQREATVGGRGIFQQTDSNKKNLLESFDRP